LLHFIKNVLSATAEMTGNDQADFTSTYREHNCERREKMLMNRWEPLTDLNRISRELDHLFGQRGGSIGRTVGSFPALNFWEDSDNLYVEAEIAGIGMDDMEIYVTGNQLTMSGERQPPQPERGTWHRQERGYGKFSRMVELPSQINGDTVSAEFQHGVLLVTLPKSEAVKPRRIEVKAS
jgi:HSP20 family protein